MATVISPVSRIVGCFYPRAPGGAYAGLESRAPVGPFEERAGTQQQRHDNDIDPHARSHHLCRRQAHVTLLPAPVSLNVRLGPGPVPARGLTDEEGSRLVQIVPPRQTWAGPGAPGDDHGIGVGHAAAGDSAASGGLRTPCNGDIDLRGRACGELSPHDDTG